MTGGCQCGSIRYTVSGDRVALYVCHCRECRNQSASAFGISVVVRRAEFSLTAGTPRHWSRKTASARILDCAFCSECGSRLWHESAGDSLVSIKGGSLDEPVDLSGATHIWTSRKLPGVVIPDGAPQFLYEPD